MRQNQQRKPQNNEQKKEGEQKKDNPLPFEDYITLQEATDGVKQGRMVVGQFHTTKYAHSVAFVKNPLLPTGDVMVDGWHNRNRALEGDMVVVELFDPEGWKAKSKDKAQDTKLGVPTLPPLPGEQRSTTVDKKATRRLLQATLGRKVIPPIFLYDCPAFPENVQPAGKIVLILHDQTAKKLRDHVLVVRVKPVMPKKQDNKDATKDDSSSSTSADAGDKNKKPPATSNIFLSPAAPATTTTTTTTQDANDKQKEEPPAPVYGNAIKCVPDNEQFPHLDLHKNSIPADLIPTLHKSLFTVRLHSWDTKHFNPSARFEKMIGELHTIEAETIALLEDNGIRYVDFPEDVRRQVEQPFQIPPKAELERTHRRDLRSEGVICCTIDPPTAKDLDDALSCKPLGGGKYQVGVHIADVSYFVPEGTPVDMEAKKRLTTTYLIQRAYPMLPRILSEEHCSLNANSDKFAFSCLWTVDEQGTVLDEWMGKSVIHNYCKMSYPIAQTILDDTANDNDFFLGDIPEERKPQVLADIKVSVKSLHKIALNLRRKRFEGGALRLSRGVLQFDFPLVEVAGATGKMAPCTEEAPTGVRLAQTQHANHLVEEFMLLANLQVAKKLAQWMPCQSMLRKHDGPLVKKINPLSENLANIGIKLEANTGYQLTQSLNKLEHHPLLPIIRVMTTYCMPLAAYVCADNEDGLFHYGLNESVYTHFTSPIRRYPDVMVHRALEFVLAKERSGEKAPPLDPSRFLTVDNIDEVTEMWHKQLEQALQEREKKKKLREEEIKLNGAAAGDDEDLDIDLHHYKKWDDYVNTPEEVALIAKACNEAKLHARKAGEASRKLFFCLWLRGQMDQHPNGLETDCFVIQYKVSSKKSKGAGFNVFIPEYAADCEFKENALGWGKIEEEADNKHVQISTDTYTERVQLLTKFQCYLLFKPDSFGRLNYAVKLKQPDRFKGTASSQKQDVPDDLLEEEVEGEQIVFDPTRLNPSFPK
eukprot:TRINITY_DN65986_c0_g1_i2.p1 TRINITY_DN65986_c0_g1~~TRINITY_DN65986_c0_g1_i2.p1  ORF type:complete len:986 (-),score=110.06 TRINITY_DN65986_c0_g1_i2:1605-4562(-)